LESKIVRNLIQHMKLAVRWVYAGVKGTLF
jgi:hypothetical protein